MRLAFGAVRSIPEGTATAWGARLIWPNDLVHDRQDIEGPDTDALRHWLNGGPLGAALGLARVLADGRTLRPDEDREVILYDDGTGKIVANPQASHGYLYVAAWLKGGGDAR